MGCISPVGCFLLSSFLPQGASDPGCQQHQQITCQIGKEHPVKPGHQQKANAQHRQKVHLRPHSHSIGPVLAQQHLHKQQHHYQGSHHIQAGHRPFLSVFPGRWHTNASSPHSSKNTTPSHTYGTTVLGYSHRNQSMPRPKANGIAPSKTRRTDTKTAPFLIDIFII